MMGLPRCSGSHHQTFPTSSNAPAYLGNWGPQVLYEAQQHGKNANSPMKMRKMATVMTALAFAPLSLAPLSPWHSPLRDGLHPSCKVEAETTVGNPRKSLRSRLRTRPVVRPGPAPDAIR